MRRPITLLAFGLLLGTVSAQEPIAPPQLDAPEHSRPPVEFLGSEFRVTALPLVPSVAIPLEILTESTTKPKAITLTEEEFNALKGAETDLIYTKAWTLLNAHLSKEANRVFDLLLQRSNMDARFWYLKAVAQYRQGNLPQATFSAKKAFALISAQPFQKKVAYAALERVQGAERQFLNDATKSISANEINQLLKD